MHKDEIRAYLRAATRQKIIYGWYFYRRKGHIYWVINPNSGDCSTYNTKGVLEFIKMLKAMNIEPEYQESLND